MAKDAGGGGERSEGSRAYERVSEPGSGVVVKRIVPDCSRGTGYRARLESAGVKLISLRHPHAETVLAIQAEEGGFSLRCEPVLGEPLTVQRMRLPEVRAIARQAAEALHAAHKLGLRHGNLSPSALWVRRLDGANAAGSLHVTVCDFGLGRPLRPLLYGADEYLAPEQVDPKNLQPEATELSDQFALATIVLELLSGRRAFAAQTLDETIKRLLREDPRYFELHNVRTREKESVNRAVHRAMQRLPHLRFPSLLEFVDALEQGESGVTGPGSSGVVHAVGQGAGTTPDPSELRIGPHPNPHQNQATAPKPPSPTIPSPIVPKPGPVRAPDSGAAFLGRLRRLRWVALSTIVGLGVILCVVFCGVIEKPEPELRPCDLAACDAGVVPVLSDLRTEPDFADLGADPADAAPGDGGRREEEPNPDLGGGSEGDSGSETRVGVSLCNKNRIIAAAVRRSVQECAQELAQRGLRGAIQSLYAVQDDTVVLIQTEGTPSLRRCLQRRLHQLDAAAITDRPDGKIVCRVYFRWQ